MGISTQHTFRLGYGYAAAEYYKFDKFLWLLEQRVLTAPRGTRVSSVLHGPFCSKEGCRVQLELSNGTESVPAKLSCPACSKKYEYESSFSQLKRLTILKYEARVRDEFNVVALDQPPADLKARDEDENYWIAARVGVKNGKRVGVVYFGEKDAEQTAKDYTQIFIDFDDEQIRHDPTNMNPNELIAKMEVEFKNSSIKKEVR